MAQSRSKLWFAALAILATSCKSPTTQPQGGVGSHLSETDATAAQTGRPEIVARFNIAKGGDVILLPVHFKNQDYQFVLDTGATISIFDTSLPLGKPKKSASADTPGGKMDLQLYARPDASFANFPLKGVKRVAGFDFEQIRQVSGHPIYGVIGMDFLAGRVLQIDFDRGELLFLKSADSFAGKAFPINYRIGTPHVSAEFFGKTHSFTIDTGYSGYS
ncbi:MAG: hypothetical protein ABIP96_03305, partial [Patescibacteria group bacterium]